MAKRQSKGLGDTIEKVTTKTGIKKVVEMFTKATGIDCGCDERKEKLNKLFPYNQKVNCLNESDYNTLGKYFDTQKSTLNVTEQKEIADVYFNVFEYRLQISSCSSCWKGKLLELEKIYNQYKINE